MRGDWARTCGRADSGLLFEAAGLADDEPDVAFHILAGTVQINESQQLGVKLHVELVQGLPGPDVLVDARIGVGQKGLVQVGLEVLGGGKGAAEHPDQEGDPPVAHFQQMTGGQIASPLR